MLVSVIELSVSTRLKTLLGVITAAIVLLMGSVLSGESLERANTDCSVESALGELTLELPSTSEKEGESDKDAEIDGDTLSLLDPALGGGESWTEHRETSTNPAAFLPLRSRVFERELFRPPQFVLAALRS